MVRVPSGQGETVHTHVVGILEKYSLSFSNMFSFARDSASAIIGDLWNSKVRNSKIENTIDCQE
jgi:hypothetical protein